MPSYISTKKKEVFKDLCHCCDENKEIVSYIRDEHGVLRNYCKPCFEDFTGKKVSKR